MVRKSERRLFLDGFLSCAVVFGFVGRGWEAYMQYASHRLTHRVYSESYSICRASVAVSSSFQRRRHGVLLSVRVSSRQMGLWRSLLVTLSRIQIHRFTLSGQDTVGLPMGSGFFLSFASVPASNACPFP